jgi:hypothetical protein
MEYHEDKNQAQNNTGFRASGETLRPYQVASDGRPYQGHNDTYTGNVQDGIIYRLKAASTDMGIKIKPAGKPDENEVAEEKQSKAPEHEGVPDSGQVSTGNTPQVTALEDYIAQCADNPVPWFVKPWYFPARED